MITQARKKQITDEVVAGIEEIRFRRLVEDTIIEALDNGTSLAEAKDRLLTAVIKRP